MSGEHTVTINPLEFVFNEHNIKDKTTGKGLCGLENLGNTCFMNSIVQCLSHTKWFREFILLDHFRKTLNENKIQYIAINEFNKLLRGLWYENAVVTPKSFFHYLQVLSIKCGSGQFVGNQQHDSSELLGFLMDCFNESLSQPIQDEFIEQTGLTGKELIMYNADKVWHSIFKSGISPIVNQFYSQLHVEITCSNCKNVSYNNDPMSILHLPIPAIEDRVPTIYDCLDLLTNNETLDNENLYKCEKCDVESNANRQEKIYKTSEHLIICFKRFSKTGEKNIKPIHFPIDNLDISKYCVCQKNTKYQLYAVSNHTGGLNGGHCFSYIESDGNWYDFNDIYVHLITKEKVLTNSAYVLFYKKI